MNSFVRLNGKLILLPLIRSTSISKCTMSLCRHQTTKTNQFRFPLIDRNYSDHPSQDPLGTALQDLVTYETISSDTLESLCEYFEDLVESTPHLRKADINYSDGVLTVNFGGSYGTYVINRQSPNRQIWLSSPTSGPKRYDYVPTGKDPISSGHWIYKHDQVTLHELLQKEIPGIVEKNVDFFNLPYGKKDS